MDCENCGNQLPETARFCNVCGKSAPPAQPPAYSTAYPATTYPASQPWQDKGLSPHHMATRGFTKFFGLHPAIAAATVMSDLMLHAAVVVSGGLLIPFSIAAGLVLGVITYLAQQKWYDDDSESALIKALIVALLTAIPSPLPYMFFIPAGIVGFFRKK